MAAVASNGFFALKNEATSVAELREFFEGKQYKLTPTEGNLFTEVKQLLTAAEKLAPLLAEKELELVFNALLNLSVIFTREQTDEFVRLVCAASASDSFKGNGWHSKAGVAMRLLSNLFHLYPDRADIRFAVYKRILEISGHAHVTRFVDTSLELTQRYADDWALNNDQRRELLRTLHNALIEDTRADEAFQVMTALLSTYAESEADRAKEDARECVRTAIVDPVAFSFDHLLRLTAVRRLRETEPKIHQLLTLFSTGQLKDYREFINTNPDLVRNQLNVDQEMLDNKMKVLTLISLAEKSKTLQLAHLAAELDIADSEKLEEFLIGAIRSNAISGKIDDHANEFRVTHVEHRTFDRPQWELLQTRFSALLKNMKRTHENLGQLLVEKNPGN